MNVAIRSLNLKVTVPAVVMALAFMLIQDATANFSDKHLDYQTLWF